jgi:hypothetical protein
MMYSVSSINNQIFYLKISGNQKKKSKCIMIKPKRKECAIWNSKPLKFKS